MKEHPSMMVLNGKVYIEGGFVVNDDEMKTVIVYDPQEDSYTTLPPYTYCYFSMAVLNNQLVLVGGLDLNSYDFTNKLGVWSESSKMWTDPLPPMTTACSRPTVVTHKDRWLIVIGGEGTTIGNRLSRVEILDTFSKQWYHSTPMPEVLGCSHTLTATTGNTCYLIGGYVCTSSAHKRVLIASLDELVLQAEISKPATCSAPTLSLWQTLPDTPLKFSTPFFLNGTLLAVGGLVKTGYQAMNAIYAYHPERKEWIVVGELPTERAQCSCTILPSGEMMVIGDNNNYLLSPAAQQVHLATVL